METKRKPGRPRTKPAAERRDDLLNAADRLFLDQGFALTSVDQITRAAGVAKGTFYLYFTTKDDVRNALDERLAQQQLNTIKKAVAAAPDQPIEAWAEAAIGAKPHPLLIDHLTELLAPLADEPRRLAMFLINGLHALGGDADPQWIRAQCAKLVTGQAPAPRPTPAKPKKPEQRQGSLF
jgi:AcrR family transcriptional regulator